MYNYSCEELFMKKFDGFYKGVDFGGWLSQCSEYTKEHYDSFIVEQDFKTVSEWGFDHVRLPVDYQVFQNNDGSLIEDGFGYVQNAIDWCKKYNLNLILDLHKTLGYSFDVDYKEDGFFDNEKLQEYFYTLWKEFTVRFSKYKDMLAFELLNEVTSKDFCKKWNCIIKKTIDLIRKDAPDIKILVGGYWNNSIDAIKDLKAPADKNIVFNFHCYEPLIFTHQGAHWVKKMPLEFRMSYPCNYKDYNNTAEKLDLPDFKIKALFGHKEIDAQYFIKRFKKGVKICEKFDIPLYCGEYGVIDKADAQFTAKWYTDITFAFNYYKIGRAFWTYKKMDFGIQDDHMKDYKDEILKTVLKD